MRVGLTGGRARGVGVYALRDILEGDELLLN
jgi:hypothetical protein